MRTYVALFFAAALLALLITPLVAALGRRLRAFGRPQQGREPSPVPRLGGLAVILAALGGLGVTLLFPGQMRERLLSEWPALVPLLVPCAMVLLLGIYDDLRGANARQKLTVQAAAAALLWWTGPAYRITGMPVLGSPLDNVVLSLLMTVLWMAAVSNAFNLIDGMDGLASGIGFFVTLSVFGVALAHGDQFVCILAAVLAGALLGFLKFNFAPARIYLGDTGSLSLGFFLAALAVYSAAKSSTALAIAVPYAAFGLPVLDTVVTVIRRFLSNKPIFTADCNHTHHRLLKRGLSPRKAALLLYAVAAALSIGSLLIVHTTRSLIALLAVMAAILTWLLTRLLRYEELAEFSAYVGRSVQSQRWILANEIMIRKTAQEMEAAETLEGSWQALASLLEALDFDAADCGLSGWPNGSAPRLAAWRSPVSAPQSDCLLVSVPLRAGAGTVGELGLWRARSKGRSLFQFTSLVERLIPALERHLQRRYEADEARARMEQAAALHLTGD